ncbi:MAG TPA: galactokinase [Planctomycetaceae bacterium]|nr:galactokinase [Planctomycetaceae bacterium]
MSLLPQLIEQIKEEFQNRYEAVPSWVVAAPGRVNLIGEHTDYNDGFVLPMAIDRYTVIAAAPAEGPKANLFSVNKNESAEIIIDGIVNPDEKVEWSSYVQGTVSCCREEGFISRPFNALIHSTVPLGGGLSSSASLEVATATLVERISGKKFEPVAKALLCQKAEHLFAKMPCGIMDQFIATMGVEGQAMLLDCRSKKMRMVPLTDANIAILIVNSNVQHELTGSNYAERRDQCRQAAEILGVPSLRDANLLRLEKAKDALGDVLYRRAKHVITENFRAGALADMLALADWESCGRHMYASHESLRDDYEVSCDELDLLVNIAKSIGMEEGVYGSRMTGGGFGGCTVSLVRAGRAVAIGEAIKTRYMEKTGIEPTVFSTKPSQGAMVIL